MRISFQFQERDASCDGYIMMIIMHGVHVYNLDLIYHLNITIRLEYRVV